MRKIVAILGLLTGVLLAGAVLEGCTDTNNCQVGSPEAFFDVQGVLLTAFRATTYQLLSPNESIAAADIRLEVRPQVRYYSFRACRAGWLPSAYACPPTPTPGYKGTSEVLDSLAVRCVYTYDAAHPAGSSLNDLLFNESDGQVLPPVPLRGTALEQQGLSLRLRRAPAQPGPQQFVVRYRLTNGETYTARTPVLALR
jgi:hypothetical protein